MSGWVIVAFFFSFSGTEGFNSHTVPTRKQFYMLQKFRVLIVQASFDFFDGASPSIDPIETLTCLHTSPFHPKCP